MSAVFLILLSLEDWSKRGTTAVLLSDAGLPLAGALRAFLWNRIPGWVSQPRGERLHAQTLSSSICYGSDLSPSLARSLCLVHASRKQPGSKYVPYLGALPGR